VPGTEVAARLTLEAAADTENATNVVTVRVTGPEDLVAEHTFALDVRGLTVEGQVQLGVAGEWVLVQIGDEWTAPDDEGQFTFGDVTVPYDLHVHGPTFSEHYIGLTTPTPQVRYTLSTFYSSIPGGFLTI